MTDGKNKDEYIAELEAERDRMKSELVGERDQHAVTNMLAYQWMKAHDALAAGKPYKFPDVTVDVPKCLAERDRVRAVVDSMRYFEDQRKWYDRGREDLGAGMVAFSPAKFFRELLAEFDKETK